jgi:acid phosphatase
MSKINKLAQIILYIFLLSTVNLNANDQKRSIKYIKSSEYNLLCEQIYASARNSFDKLSFKNIKSVLMEQQESEGLPLAVVTDIDETILLNYEFQKKLSETNQKFTYKLFENYINKKTAIAIHGSVEYFKYLSDKGVHIIYISNRKYSSEEKTYEHLRDLGYPLNSRTDLLLQNEKENWSYNKSTRRAYIAKKYKVIQVFGDSLLDFAKKEEIALANKDKFGHAWFLLPNPFYGNWLNEK